MKNWIARRFNNPQDRLVARAVIAGIVAAFHTLKTGNHYSLAAFEAAGVAGIWAAIEGYTPINKTVGKFKTLAGIMPPNA